jgi:hypothetical protein
MNNLSRALAVALMAATIPATIVLAQQATPADQPAVEKTDAGRRGPSPETLARLQDGRIAMAKAALKLSPDQEKLWVPVEEKIRANFEERSKRREAWQAKREERRAEKKAHGDDDKFAEVLKPLYATFSEDQKAVAGRVLNHFGQDGKGQRGPRWAMGGGRHGHGFGRD